MTDLLRNNLVNKRIKSKVPLEIEYTELTDIYYIKEWNDKHMFTPYEGSPKIANIRSFNLKVTNEMIFTIIDIFAMINPSGYNYIVIIGIFNNNIDKISDGYLTENNKCNRLDNYGLSKYKIKTKNKICSVNMSYGFFLNSNLELNKNNFNLHIS